MIYLLKKVLNFDTPSKKLDSIISLAKSKNFGNDLYEKQRWFIQEALVMCYYLSSFPDSLYQQLIYKYKSNK